MTPDTAPGGGEIRKHGNAIIGTLRKTYDPDFAKGCAEEPRCKLGCEGIVHKADIATVLNNVCFRR